MRTCAESLELYWLKAFGVGPRLPKTDFTLCDHLVLIAGGMGMNLYFALIAVGLGFCLALGLAVMKASDNRALRLPASWMIFFFRGSPIFIQFYFAYALFVKIPSEWMIVGSLRKVWFGALVVLTLNTACYSAEIFYGALRAVPKGDVEAAKAYGMGPWTRFRRVTLPTMMRLAWPAYTNEAIFLFHATTLVFLSSFPALAQMGEALRYVRYFNAQTFNPFISFPIIAIYFLIVTSVIIFLFGRVNLWLNRHQAPDARVRVKYRPNLLR